MLFSQSLPPGVSKSLMNLSNKTKGFGNRASLPLAYIHSNNVFAFFIEDEYNRECVVL